MNATASKEANAGGAGPVERCEVLIIGGGMSGIAMGAMLAEQGIDDYLVLERSDGLGGTWHLNTYPGCACDIPSALYSFGFRPNPGWSRLFAPQPEILAYLRRVADECGVTQRARLHTEMRAAAWNEERRCWVVHTGDRVYESKWLLLGTGSLHATNMAEIPGADTFRGKVFHSSHWPEGYTAAGERVAVIGTGASSIQLTPRLGKHAERVHLFQRTPAWIQPRPNLPHGPRIQALFRRFPATQRALRGAEWALGEFFMAGVVHRWLGELQGLLPKLHLRIMVRDRMLRRKLTPSYRMGCKRLLVSNDFYPALTSGAVELIDSAAARITEDGIVAANGEQRAVDTIVFATGFHFGAGPAAHLVTGRDGRSMAQVWDGSPNTYIGTSVSGFPNLALLWGPNAGTASIAVSIEAQTRYVARMIASTRSQGLEVVDVRRQPQEDFKRKVASRLDSSVMVVGGCTSYYLDEKGKNMVLWPGTMTDMWRRMKHFEPRDYDVLPAVSALAGASENHQRLPA